MINVYQLLAACDRILVMHGNRAGFMADARSIAATLRLLLTPLEGWHVGRNNPRNVWNGDRPVCHCETEEDAARIVEAMKRSAAPEPEMEWRIISPSGSHWSALLSEDSADSMMNSGDRKQVRVASGPWLCAYCRKLAHEGSCE